MPSITRLVRPAPAAGISVPAARSSSYASCANAHSPDHLPRMTRRAVAPWRT
jgi:hypothetical protein